MRLLGLRGSGVLEFCASRMLVPEFQCSGVLLSGFMIRCLGRMRPVARYMCRLHLVDHSMVRYRAWCTCLLALMVFVGSLAFCLAHLPCSLLLLSRWLSCVLVSRVCLASSSRRAFVSHALLALHAQMFDVACLWLWRACILFLICVFVLVVCLAWCCCLARLSCVVVVWHV